MSASEPFVIIANSGVPINSISKDALKDIFLGVEVIWKNNQEIKLCTMENLNLHNQFTREIAHKTSKQFKAWWKTRLFLGQGSLPLSFEGEDALVDYVSKTTGAIGYVSVAPSNSHIKTIKLTDSIHIN